MTNIELLEDKIEKYGQILSELESIKEYKGNKLVIDELSARLLELTGKGNWVSHGIKTKKKSELLRYLIDIANRFIYSSVSVLDEVKLQKGLAKSLDPSQYVIKEIHDDRAELIGEGEWFKDSAFRVYKVDNKFYTIVVMDQMDLWLDDKVNEIEESEIKNYI